jgi:hypothetical protein
MSAAAVCARVQSDALWPWQPRVKRCTAHLLAPLITRLVVGVLILSLVALALLSGIDRRLSPGVTLGLQIVTYGHHINQKLK